MLGLFQSCISTSRLPKDQYILHSQEVKGNKEVSSEALGALYRQEPNRKILGLLPYVWAYQLGQKLFRPRKVQTKIEQKEEKFDQKIQRASRRGREKKIRRLIKRKNKKIQKLNRKLQEGNWLMRSVGEPPVFYDSLEARRTAQEMQELLSTKGYFQGQVKIDTQKVFKNRIKVKYFIEENEPTFFGDIAYVSGSLDIDSILAQSEKNSYLETGEHYDENLIAKEYQRIEKLLRNNGYLYFSRQYIVFSIDTLHFADSLSEDTLMRAAKADTLVNGEKAATKSAKEAKRNADVKVIINDPNQGKHKSYRLDRIFFHVVNTTKNVQRASQIDTLRSPDSGIHYVYEGKRIRYNYKILDQRVRMRPQQKYGESRLTETQRSLGILDMFKFVNINPDTSRSHLDMHIYTTPMDKYQITDEIGFNVIQGLPGPFINLSLKNRNTFGGAEIFENSLRFAIDGQTSFAEEENFYSSQEIGFNSSLTFPRILFPLPSRFRNRLHEYNPTTRLNLGFNYTNRPEYTRTNLAASISYQGQLGFSTYNITLADLNVVNTRDISNAFNQVLSDLSDSGNPIIESFDRALVSSMYVIYTYNTNVLNESKKAFLVRVLVEGGGMTLGLFRRSSLIEENRVFGLRVFQFWRVNPSFNYYMPLAKKFHTMAFRINVGLARPFGSSTTLPYEKFFFAGGSSSIRAWQPRRLGPGSFRPPVNEDGTFDYRFEQPGEILLEGNIEYRFPIFGFVRGALFVDAGNIWTFERDELRPGSQFRFRSFWNEIALGTGFGVRLNLPFLLFRLDFGLKVYDPARRSDRRWVIRQFNPLNPLEKDFLLLNIGIGYPF